MQSSRTDSKIIHLILIAVAMVAVAAVLWLVADAFVIAFGGIVVASVLRAGAVPLARLCGWSERLSLVVVVVGVVAVVGLLGWMFGAQAANQFAELRDRLPEAAAKLKGWLEESRAGKAIIESADQLLSERQAASGMGVIAGAIVAGFGHLLLILFAGIYFAADPVLYRDGALRLLPVSRRPQVKAALDEAGGALQRWLVGQLIVMVAVGVLTGGALALLGVPLSLALGVLIGLFEFVPVIGPIAGAAPGVLLAFAKDPQTALFALLIYIGVQQVESNLLTPLVQRWAVHLPPVVALLSLVAGGLLFGILGVIFATPLAVVVMVLVRKLYVEDTLENGRRADSRAKAGA